MTPEERASAIVAAQGDWSYMDHGPDTSDLVIMDHALAERIAAAIREAENAVLEGAAVGAEMYGAGMVNEWNEKLGVVHHYTDAAEDIAEHIRNLKHKSAT